MEDQDYPIAHFESMTRLARALKALPAQIVEHQYDNGSWYSVIRYKGRAFRRAYGGQEDDLRLYCSRGRNRPYAFDGGQTLCKASLGNLADAAIEVVCRAIAS